MLVGRTHARNVVLSIAHSVVAQRRENSTSVYYFRRTRWGEWAGRWVWVHMVRDDVRATKSRSGEFLRICVFLVLIVTCATAACCSIILVGGCSFSPALRKTSRRKATTIAPLCVLVEYYYYCDEVLLQTHSTTTSTILFTFDVHAWTNKKTIERGGRRQK